MDGRISTCAWNKLYRMEPLDGLRFPEGRNYEDVATTYGLVARCRLLVWCGLVPSVERCLYHHVKRPGSIAQTRSLANMGDYWASSRERYEFCMHAGSGCGVHTGSGCGERTESHARRSMAGTASVV